MNRCMREPKLAFNLSHCVVHRWWKDIWWPKSLYEHTNINMMWLVLTSPLEFLYHLVKSAKQYIQSKYFDTWNSDRFPSKKKIKKNNRLETYTKPFDYYCSTKFNLESYSSTQKPYIIDRNIESLDSW